VSQQCAYCGEAHTDSVMCPECVLLLIGSLDALKKERDAFLLQLERLRQAALLAQKALQLDSRLPSNGKGFSPRVVDALDSLDEALAATAPE
jgi:hypothetical protein